MALLRPDVTKQHNLKLSSVRYTHWIPEMHKT